MCEATARLNKNKMFSRHLVNVSQTNIGKVFSLKTLFPFDMDALPAIVDVIDPQLPVECGGIFDWLHIWVQSSPSYGLHVSHRDYQGKTYQKYGQKYRRGEKGGSIQSVGTTSTLRDMHNT